MQLFARGDGANHQADAQSHPLLECEAGNRGDLGSLTPPPPPPPTPRPLLPRELLAHRLSFRAPHRPTSCSSFQGKVLRCEVAGLLLWVWSRP